MINLKMMRVAGAAGGFGGSGPGGGGAGRPRAGERRA